MPKEKKTNFGFSQFNRRLHLYMGLLLLPWIVMYGTSAFVINHNDYFQSLYDDGQPAWNQRSVENYDRTFPPGTDRREIANTVLADLQIDDEFDVRWQGQNRLLITTPGFWSMTRVTWDVDKQRVSVADRRFQWNSFFIRLHERSGYHYDSWLHDLWAITVDLTCAGFLVFIASGLYMWWQIRRTRLRGGLALAGGVASFGMLLVFL